MELRQLEYFVAVAEEANFTRAALRVHITQSGVSAQVRQLERELGAELIDRSGRHATLTTAGAAALAHARRALASADAVRRAVDEVTGLLRGELTVGMVTACTVVPLFEALAAFHRAHPGVSLSLEEDASDRLLDRVRDGHLDLALVGVAGATPEDLGGHEIVRERLVAVAPPGHPLTARNRRRTTLAAVCEHQLVCLPPGTGIRAVLEEACADAGRHPTIALQASAPDAVLDLARRGLGVAVLSETMARDLAADLRAVTVADVEPRAVLALVWPRNPSPAARALAERCRAAFSSAGPAPS